MRLKRLEIYGFKSFADRTVVVFDEGITGIVGPNGSGKSNLSDAVRWVLGEQSAKALRGGKMEDVIFNGTQKRKRMGYCEVSLVFENEDHALSVDYTEVMITRRVYRSGEGEYYINKSACRLKDIVELFRDTGVGKEGYSIIGQGRIDEILSQKSEDRRGVFEEAAGIVKYRTRKEESEKRLSNMRDNLSRVEDIIAELESQLEPLEKASETARRYLNLRDELRVLECSAFVLRSDRAKERIAEAEQLLTGLKEAIASEEKRADALSEQREKANEGAQKLENEVTAAHDAVLELTRETEAREGELGVLRAEINRMEKDVLALGQEEDVKRARSAALDEEIAKNERDALANRTRIIGLTRELGQKEEALQNAQEEARQAEEKLEAHKSAIIDAMNRLSDVRTSEARLSTMRKELERRGEEADAQREKVAQAAQRMDEQLAQADGELEQAKRGEAEKTEIEQNIELEAQENGQKIAVVQKALGDANGQKQATSSRLRVLREMERDYAGYQQAVKQVLLHARGNAGVRGVVATLMRVPKRLERATEAVLGGALQNVVTTDEYIARDMIAYLRQNKLGRATFLPMTAIKPRPFREDGLDSCAGFIDMADRLLRCDDEYLPIIRNLLSHTAVADNIDSAIAISKRFGHRFKVVTLDGQVMNAGGSMTGGSRGQNAGILSRGNDIEQLKKTVAKLEKDLAERQERYKELAGEVSAAQAEYDGVTAELQKAQEEKIRREGELRMIDDKIETAESALNDLEAEKRSSAERTAKLEEIQTQVQKKIDEFTSQLDSVNEKITEIESRRDELLSTREQNADKESSINLSILAFKKDIQAREEVIETLKRRRSSHEGHADELKSEIDSITEQMTATNELIEQLKGEAASLRAEAQQKKDEISSLAQKRSGVEGESTKLRAQERSVSDRRERLSGERARLEERRDSMQRELENAQNKLYDEYQLTRREAEELGIVIEDPQKAQRDLNDIKNKIRALGNVNVGAIEEYKEVSERYEFMKTQIDDVESSRAELLALIGDLTGKMSERFREQFDRINTIFGQTFSELFGGGKAELILENPLDVLECAIEIKVQPPGKNVQNIDLLSGGEKGLAAIALLFSILKVTPAPFCFFDEVEAALDDVNVTRYAQYARRMTKNTQFILITHRRGTMEEADVLYGVTMQEDGVSKLLELKTAEMAKKLGLTQ